MTSDDAYSYISESHACHNNTTLSEKVDTFINGEDTQRRMGVTKWIFKAGTVPRLSMIPCSRSKLSDFCTLSRAKLLEKHTLHSGR